MTFGLDSTGFTPAPYAQIREQFVTQFVASLAALDSRHSQIDTSDAQKLGKLISLYCAWLAQAWEQLQAIYLTFDPDSNNYDQLVRLAALTGTTPRDALPSEVTLLLLGDAGVTVPVASRVRDVAKRQVETLAAATLAAPSARTANTVYAIDDLVIASGAIYRCDGAGTTSAGGDPFTGIDVIDGSVSWRYVGESAAAAYVEAQAVEVGALAFLAGSLTDIATPLAGWSGVTNPRDADLGRAAESYESLHLRRELDLARSAEGSPDALRAAILDLDNVRGCSVLVNRTSATVDGVPAHGVHVLVRGGDEIEIAQAIYDNGGLAPAYAGSTAVTITSTEGNEYTIRFSRPTEIPIYVTYDLEVDAIEVQDGLSAELLAAVLTWETTRKSGQNVRSSALAALAHKFPGVLGAVAKIGTSASPSATTAIAVDVDEIATFDSTRIVVNITEVTP
ncbi:MAG: hypothetical protein E6Q97_02835 [Desulfurellales bacterium]|nr:MAG: hypothetical protein E6Q97_02835 [Desulfurellales bacterium]